MSRLVSTVWVTALLLGVLNHVGAQTIGDYSRSQRAVIEAAIARNAARAQPHPTVQSPPAGMPSLAPVTGAGMPPSTPAVVARELDPDVVVTGVIISKGHRVAEVEVDGAAYMLAAGQQVPGTPWRVEQVSSDRVLLIDPRRRGSPAGLRSVSLITLGHRP